MSPWNFPGWPAGRRRKDNSAQALGWNWAWQNQLSSHITWSYMKSGHQNVALRIIKYVQSNAIYIFLMLCIINGNAYYVQILFQQNVTLWINDVNLEQLLKFCIMEGHTEPIHSPFQMWIYSTIQLTIWRQFRHEHIWREQNL